MAQEILPKLSYVEKRSKLLSKRYWSKLSVKLQFRYIKTSFTIATVL